MNIRFSLAWLKAGQSIVKGFKSPGACLLFQDYTQRICRFMPCDAGVFRPKSRSIIWICEREQHSRMLSSVELAKALDKAMASGGQELQIVIGGPDGFTPEQQEKMQPALRWSFGPLTLPHELALVVATEQIYRALCIIKNHPYHSGHTTK